MTNPPQSEYNRVRLRKMNYKRTKTKRIIGLHKIIDTSMLYQTVPQYPKALPVGKFE